MSLQESSTGAHAVSVSLGGDHAGVRLKEWLRGRLDADGHEVVDHGTFGPDPVDFPDVAAATCAPVAAGQAARAVLVCGTGVGASIAANKIAGVRAAVIHDVYSAHQAVEHDDVNVACIGADVVGRALAYELVTTFLRARFDATDDHLRRVAKLDQLDTVRRS